MLSAAWPGLWARPEQPAAEMPGAPSAVTGAQSFACRAIHQPPPVRASKHIGLVMLLCFCALQPHALESDEPVRTTSLMRLPSTGHFSSIDSLALEPASTSDTAIDSSQHANSISSPSQRMSCDLQQGQDTTQSTPQQDTAQPLSSKVKGVRRRRSSRVVDSEDEAMLDAMSQGDATASRRQSTEQRDTLSGSAAGRFLSTIVNSLSRRRSGASGDSGGGSGSRDTSAARDNGARGSVGGTSSAAHTGTQVRNGDLSSKPLLRHVTRC